MNLDGYSDPYAILEWGGQRYMSRVHRGTLDPSFDETMYFHVRQPQCGARHAARGLLL